MSENVATSTTQQLTPELQQHLAMAFNEPLPPPSVQPPAATAESASTDTDIAAPTQPSSTQPGQPSNEEVVYYDPNEYLKQQLGFDSWDSAKEAIEKLRQPQAPTPIQYKNEHSRRWHEYLENDKEDDLYNALHARQQVKNLESLNEEQRIKLFIKMNNPMFDQELIDYQFQKDYGFDENQYKDENGVITDPLAYRHAKVASMQRMQGDLAKANDFFNTYKNKIELPEIKPQATFAADPDFESYKASTASANEAYQKQIVPALQGLLESDLNMAFSVDDPNNQMKFDIGVTVDKEDFNSARDKSLYFRDWIDETFYDDKGVFQPKKLARAILLEKNFDKYVQTIARQAVNAERKRVIEKETPNTGQRMNFNVAPEVKSEIDQHMQMAFSV